jgi:hypothetical protein
MWTTCMGLPKKLSLLGKFHENMAWIILWLYHCSWCQHIPHGQESSQWTWSQSGGPSSGHISAAEDYLIMIGKPKENLYYDL